MAVRLSVVLVQSSRMSGLQSGINADLVFQLMGVSGVDLSIVNSLHESEIAETDRMMLSALDTDLAVIDWSEPDETLIKLVTLGIRALRAPHQLDPTVPSVPPGNRRAYLVDLRNGYTPAEVVAAMKGLLDQRRVIAVPLSIGGSKNASGLKPAASALVNTSAILAEKSSVANRESSLVSTSSDKSEAFDSSITHRLPGDATNASLQNAPTEGDLDALVDGLNAGDW